MITGQCFRFCSVVLAGLVAGCGSNGSANDGPDAETEQTAAVQAAPNTLTARELTEGWRLLFDGTTTAGWRGYRSQALAEGWQVVDGALTRVAAGGDIVSVDTFGDFELRIDWNVSPGGNSGVFFRANETTDYVWQNSPELQVLDNAAHRDGLTAETSAGSNYALHAPAQDVVRPAGEWNEVRLIVRGAHVEHWLNGVKIVEYELWSDDWKARVAASKFNETAAYGQATSGHIALQDHGDRVAFRNIMIRSLTGT